MHGSNRTVLHVNASKFYFILFYFFIFLFLGGLQISYYFFFSLFFLASKFPYFISFLALYFPSFFGLQIPLLVFLFVWLSISFFFSLLSNFLSLFSFFSCFQISCSLFQKKKKKLSSFAPIMKFGLHLDLVLALAFYFTISNRFCLFFKKIQFLKKNFAQVMIIHKNI